MIRSSILFTTLLGIGLFASSSHAGVQKDINQKMTKLLAHAPLVMNVFEAQKQGLNQATTRFQPWSSSYWPDITGGITNHYRLHNKASAKINFALNYGTGRKRFVGDHENAVENVNVWDSDTLNQGLSASEKYDLLLGDLNFSFTKAIMEEIDFRAHSSLRSVKTDGSSIDETDMYEGDSNNFNEESENETEMANPKTFKWSGKRTNALAYWSGICDGWSPASIYLPRPAHSVTLTGALGHKIVFYPDDLKALGSYLFARTNTPYMGTMNYQYAGKRCNEKGNPDRGEGGRVEDSRCNDLDAGVWHATLLNRIGKDSMGFVMDFDNNTKVNNHPVYHYELKYYNPATGKEGSLKDSLASRGDIKFDGYAGRRNPNTVYILGVKSKIKYVYYIWAEDHHETTTDSLSEDETKEQEYTYDLELDADGNILGGEWGDRSRDRKIIKKVKYAEQPDFIWMASPNALPFSEMSQFVVQGDKVDTTLARPFGNMNWSWKGGAMPSDWINAAKEDEKWVAPEYEVPGAVLKSAQPLSSIVYYLFDQARVPAQN